MEALQTPEEYLDSAVRMAADEIFIPPYKHLIKSIHDSQLCVFSAFISDEELYKKVDTYIKKARSEGRLPALPDEHKDKS